MELFDRFRRERTYLGGVSPETLRYCRWVRRAFETILANPTKPGMMDCVAKMLAKGVSPTSVNTYLRGFKAYTRWLHQEGLLKELFKVQFLKTEQKILATLSPDQTKRLLTFRSIGLNQTRAHTAALLILDLGYRASEVLTLRIENCDFDNSVIQIRGKG